MWRITSATFSTLVKTLPVSAAEAKKIADYLKAVRSGKMPDLIKDGSMQFHILGLAPNASRLAVRFWHTDSVEAFSKQLGRHFADLEIIKEFDNQPDYPGIWQLLIETAPLRKTDNMNPNLAGALLRSILQPIPYPGFLLAAVIDRIRADHDVNYYRAALIKAVLRRNYGREDLAMALDEDSKDVAYRLGRLFAVLEKAQKDVDAGPERNDQRPFLRLGIRDAKGGLSRSSSDSRSITSRKTTTGAARSTETSLYKRSWTESRRTKDSRRI